MVLMGSAKAISLAGTLYFCINFFTTLELALAKVVMLGFD